MKAPPVREKVVLVTGASTGIGRATARMLRDAGWRVWPTARKPQDLDDLRREGFDPIALDVGDSSSVECAAEECLRRGPLGALVNNAGYGQPGAVEDLTREALRRQFEVNVFGLQELTNRFIPIFRKQGFGRIVNVSSVVGWLTLPFLGAYAASKHALESLSDALRIELRGSGVAVSIIEPGPIETPFRKNAFEVGQATINVEKSFFREVYEAQARRSIATQFRSRHPFTAPPEDVARSIRHALESRRPRRRYVVTFQARLGIWMARFAPAALTDAILAQFRD